MEKKKITHTIKAAHYNLCVEGSDGSIGHDAVTAPSASTIATMMPPRLACESDKRRPGSFAAPQSGSSVIHVGEMSTNNFAGARNT